MATWKERAPEIQSLLDQGRHYSEIAVHYGVSRKNMRNRIAELKAQGLVGEPGKEPTESVKVQQESLGKNSLERNADGSYTSVRNKLWLRNDMIYNDDYILLQHGFKPEDWKIVNVRHNQWENYSKKNGITELFASKVTVTPRKDEMTPDDLRKLLVDAAREYRRPTIAPIATEETGKLLEVNVADLHLGKLSWVGDANDTYNAEIARERFFYVINKVLSRTKTYNFERILFVFSNDFFHYDSEAKTTTSGTPQDTNLQYTQMFKTGVMMLVEAIDILSQVAPVMTFYIGSNHDKLTSYHATEFLYAWYRNDPNVVVDADPKIRKYFEFGDCLIGFSHGHAEKNRLGKIMPIEAREAWGRTIYHEYHCGHWHTDRVVVEENGVIVRYLPSVTGTDNWHYESGYVGAVQKSQSFVWDRHEGVEQIINATVIGKSYGKQNVCLV